MVLVLIVLASFMFGEPAPEQSMGVLIRILLGAAGLVFFCRVFRIMEWHGLLPDTEEYNDNWED